MKHCKFNMKNKTPKLLESIEVLIAEMVRVFKN